MAIARARQPQVRLEPLARRGVIGLALAPAFDRPRLSVEDRDGLLRNPARQNPLEPSILARDEAQQPKRPGRRADAKDNR